VQVSFKFADCMKQALLESVAIQKVTAVYSGERPPAWASVPE
jgi:hypothetical protein